MSPINFALLQAEYPELIAEWQALQRWFTKNWRKQYAELSLLLRDIKDADRLRLVLAIDLMVESGMLTISYRLRSPDGDLLEGDFDEPDQIPEELWSRDASHLIPRSESDIVSGFRWEFADAA